MIKTKIELDQKINDIENILSFAAVNPIIGTLAGGAKVCLGVAQSFTALAIFIITSIPAAYTGNWSTSNYAWSHVKHGLGNIVTGTLESIPLVGTFLGLLRLQRTIISSFEGFEGDTREFTSTGHANKFMPYESLVERDSKLHYRSTF